MHLPSVFIGNLPINTLGKCMSTKGTKHLPKFYLHFTYKYQQCMDAMTFSRYTWDEKIRWQFANHISNAPEAISKVESPFGDERCDQRDGGNI